MVPVVTRVVSFVPWISVRDLNADSWVAFQDRGAGARRNQGRSTEETPRDGARGGAGARVRGGRGARRAHERDDRHPSKFGGHGYALLQSCRVFPHTD